MTSRKPSRCSRGIAAEFVLEDDADAEPHGDRLADRLAAADLDHLIRLDPGLGHGPLEDRARGRAHLAQDEALAVQLLQADAAPGRPGMAALDEDDQAVGAEGHGVEPLVRADVGQHRDVAAPVE